MFNRQLKPNVSETILYLFIPPRLFPSYPNPNHVIFLESGCTIQSTTYPVTMAKISVILNPSFFTPIQTATNSRSFPSVAGTPSLHLHRYYLSASTHHCFPEYLYYSLSRPASSTLQIWSCTLLPHTFPRDSARLPKSSALYLTCLPLPQLHISYCWNTLPSPVCLRTIYSYFKTQFIGYCLHKGFPEPPKLSNQIKE